MQQRTPSRRTIKSKSLNAFIRLQNSMAQTVRSRNTKISLPITPKLRSLPKTRREAPIVQRQIYVTKLELSLKIQCHDSVYIIIRAAKQYRTQTMQLLQGKARFESLNYIRLAKQQDVDFILFSKTLQLIGRGSIKQTLMYGVQARINLSNIGQLRMRFTNQTNPEDALKSKEQLRKSIKIIMQRNKQLTEQLDLICNKLRQQKIQKHKIQRLILKAQKQLQLKERKKVICGALQEQLDKLQCELRILTQLKSQKQIKLQLRRTRQSQVQLQNNRLDTQILENNSRIIELTLNQQHNQNRRKQFVNIIDCIKQQISQLQQRKQNLDRLIAAEKQLAYQASRLNQQLQQTKFKFQKQKQQQQIEYLLFKQLKQQQRIRLQKQQQEKARKQQDQLRQRLEQEQKRRQRQKQQQYKRQNEQLQRQKQFRQKQSDRIQLQLKQKLYYVQKQLALLRKHQQWVQQKQRQEKRRLKQINKQLKRKQNKEKWVVQLQRLKRNSKIIQNNANVVKSFYIQLNSVNAKMKRSKWLDQILNIKLSINNCKLWIILGTNNQFQWKFAQLVQGKGEIDFTFSKLSLNNENLLSLAIPAQQFNQNEGKMDTLIEEEVQKWQFSISYRNLSDEKKENKSAKVTKMLLKKEWPGTRLLFLREGWSRQKSCPFVVNSTPSQQVLSIVLEQDYHILRVAGFRLNNLTQESGVVNLKGIPLEQLGSQVQIELHYETKFEMQYKYEEDSLFSQPEDQPMFLGVSDSGQQEEEEEEIEKEEQEKDKFQFNQDFIAPFFD